jgi:hypothetical protein
MMKTISIASNEDSVFIRSDKTLLDEKKIIQFLDLIEKIFPEITTFPIESVDEQEQTEIESVLDNMSDDDKKITVSRFVTL